MNTTQTPKTPGYSHRLEIFFKTDCNGNKLAYYYSVRQFRAFRIGLAKAELLLAQGQADQIAGHPFESN